MKFHVGALLVLLLAIGTLTEARRNDPSLDDIWLSFKQQHSKVYLTEKEEQFRLALTYSVTQSVTST